MCVKRHIPTLCIYEQDARGSNILHNAINSLPNDTLPNAVNSLTDGPSALTGATNSLPNSSDTFLTTVSSLDHRLAALGSVVPKVFETTPAIPPRLISELPPLSALDSIQYAIQAHTVSLDWFHLRSRIARVCHAQSFNTSSSQDLILYSLATASFALSGFISAAMFSESMQRESNASTPLEAHLSCTLAYSQMTSRQLLRLSEDALGACEASRNAPEQDYISALIIQILCGLYGGRLTDGLEKGLLDPKVFTTVSISLIVYHSLVLKQLTCQVRKLVSVATEMGYMNDPDCHLASLDPGIKQTRRKLWWDVYRFDL
jgi:hypothetical protein